MLARMAENLQHEPEVSESRCLKLSLTKEGPNENKVQVNRPFAREQCRYTSTDHPAGLDTKLTENRDVC